jgi:hypothetical protein
MIFIIDEHPDPKVSITPSPFSLDKSPNTNAIATIAPTITIISIIRDF